MLLHSGDIRALLLGTKMAASVALCVAACCRGGFGSLEHWLMSCVAQHLDNTTRNSQRKWILSACSVGCHSSFCSFCSSDAPCPICKLPFLFHQLSFSSKFLCSHLSSNLYSGNYPLSPQAKAKFRGFKIQSVRPSIQVFCLFFCQKMAFKKVRIQVKELIDQKTWLECSPGGLGLSNPYPKSMLILCETPNKLLISDTWRQKLHLKKSII